MSETVPPGQLRAGAIVAALALREAVRRRVLLVVSILTAAFLALYGIGTHFAFKESAGFAGQMSLDDRALTGATLLGLAMFVILFLGAVLATFLTIGIVRGGAETGMLQPLVARPPSRTTIVLARATGAAAVSAAFVVGVFLLSLVITWVIGDWTPDRPLAAAALLAAAVVTIVFISTLASVWMGATAQGIAVLMAYGAGLTAGLLAQIGEGLDSDRLERVGVIAAWVLPFEAIYQDALHALTADTGGITGLVVSLGPFGGARSGGTGLALWAVAYVILLAAGAAWGFRRRDL